MVHLFVLLLEAIWRRDAKIKELEAQVQTLEETANTDALTGLQNRRAFAVTLARERDRVVRGNGAFCLALIDVDHFKQVNDTYGHDVGDQVLKMLGSILREALPRKTDFCGRYGGEEFVVILPNTELTQACIAMERTRTLVEKNLRLETTLGQLARTVSIGVAKYRPGEDPQKTLKRADNALYQAKCTGRNRIGVASIKET